MTTTRQDRLPSRRQLLALLGAAMLAPLPALAQDYPARPITIVVPATAGGPTDVLTRLIAQGMARDLGQAVVVENVSGASGSIGQARVARAAPDGYTLLVGNVGLLAVTGAFYDKLPYDAGRDFLPIASLGDAAQVLSVRASLPVANLDEFAAYVRNHQAGMNYGTAGMGSGAHLGALLLNEAIGANVQPVHYRGGIQATQDVMAGNLDYMIESSSTAVASIASGKVKGLAVLRPQRVDVLPGVQATGESKFPQLHYDIWNMLVAPRGIDAAVANRLNASINKVLADPEVHRQFAQMGLSVPSERHRSLAGSGELLTSEIARWKSLVDRSGAKLAAK